MTQTEQPAPQPGGPAPRRVVIAEDEVLIRMDLAEMLGEEGYDDEARIAPVVILTAFSQRELVERARDAGAMAYLVKPFSRSDLVPAIEMAVSRFAELALLEAEVADLTERLETRKAVDRAKGVLQEQLHLSEPDAFRWIQKTAMDLRLSMRQVADGVITHGPGLAG
ncbi:MAG: ANTAR domain-containing protein [Nocardioides sp.]|nr:ANTAR domain-containing protein [Nocardioides sp.]